MIYRTQKGQYSSGEAIGILLLETSVPFIPGDVANATTYDFPVRFQPVKGFTVARAIGKDPTVYPDLKRAAEMLKEQGVRAVTGDCGFMAVHQKRLAKELGLPVFLSSLIQIPFIAAIIGSDKKIGILTADSHALTSELFRDIGVENTDGLVVEGLEASEHFYQSAIEETGELDSSAIEKEVVRAAEKMIERDSAIRALLLECSLLPPYAAAVQQAVNLPVFDYITMIDYVFSALKRRRFSGFV